LVNTAYPSGVWLYAARLRLLHRLVSTRVLRSLPRFVCCCIHACWFTRTTLWFFAAFTPAFSRSAAHGLHLHHRASPGLRLRFVLRRAPGPFTSRSSGSCLYPTRTLSHDSHACLTRGCRFAFKFYSMVRFPYTEGTLRIHHWRRPPALIAAQHAALTHLPGAPFAFDTGSSNWVRSYRASSLYAAPRAAWHTLPSPSHIPC